MEREIIRIRSKPVKVIRIYDDLEFTITLIVSGLYTPGRPPPPAGSHDSPGFSDPGDPDVIEVHTIDSVDTIEVTGYAHDEDLEALLETAGSFIPEHKRLGNILYYQIGLWLYELAIYQCGLGNVLTKPEALTDAEVYSSLLPRLRGD